MQLDFAVLILTKLLCFMVFGMAMIFLLTPIADSMFGETSSFPHLRIVFFGVSFIGFVSSLIGLIDTRRGSGFMAVSKLLTIWRRIYGHCCKPISSPILRHHLATFNRAWSLASFSATRRGSAFKIESVRDLESLNEDNFNL